MDLLAGYASEGGSSDEDTKAPRPPAVNRSSGSLFSKLPPPSSVGSSSVSTLGSLPAPSHGALGRKVLWKVPISSAALAAAAEEDANKSLKKKQKSSKGSSLSSMLPAPKNVFGGAATRGASSLLGAGTSGAASGTASGTRHTLQLNSEAAPGPNAESIPQLPFNENSMYRVDANGQYAVSLPATSVVTPEAEPQGDGASRGGPATHGPVTHYDYFPKQHNAATPYMGTIETLQQETAAVGEVSGMSLLQAELERERERQVKLGRKPGKVPQIVNISQEKLKYVAPTANAAANASQMAFGPQYAAQLRKEAGAKGSRIARQKHQIGTLYHDMKLAELDMLEKRTSSQKSKAETAAKYGW